MREKGVTLLELLIAITIFSLIAVIIGGSVRLGVRAWERGESGVNNSQRMRVLLERFTQQLKSVYPYQIEMDGKKVVAFQGGHDSLWFVTSAINPLEGGLKWLSYSVKEGNLIIKEGRLPDKKVLEKISGEEGGEGDIIDSEVLEFSLEYLPPEGEEWEDVWEFKKELPEALRIKVDDQLPSFTIPIPLGVKDESSLGEESKR
jgi:general secretion pathway protein J